MRERAAGLIPAGQSAGINSPLAAKASGDFNGDGYPDLVVANDGSPGTVSVVLNAADWGGGPAPVSANSHTLAGPGKTSGPSPRDPLSAAFAIQDPQTIRQRPLPSRDLQRDLVSLAPVATATGQATPPNAISTQMLLDLTRHSQDTVSEGWADPVVDALAVSLMAPRR